MSSIRFDGQAVVVTGSGRGLGRSYALEFARRGAAVVINDLGVDEGGIARSELVAEEIRAAGGRAVADRSDISTSAGGRAVVELAVEEFGRVDVVVNNAGFIRPRLVEDLQDDDVESMVNVHLMAAFHTTRAAWSHMRQQGYGRIVLTSSGSSFGQKAQSNYAAAKAGVIGLARALAEEGREYDIRANCVLPFANSLIGVDNPLVGSDTDEIRRMLNLMTSRRAPETVAPLTLYLASRECAVSGEAYSALAGRYARVIFGLTEGWISRDAAMTSPEDIAEHLDTISDTSEFIVPMTMQAEIDSVLKRLESESLLSGEA